MTNTALDGALPADSAVAVSVRPGRRTSLVLALALLPWIMVVLFTAGAWAALNFLAYTITVFAVGYGIIGVTLLSSARSLTIVLAPATGILAISALTAFWVRLGFPLIWVTPLWLALTVAGMLVLWRDRAIWSKNTIAYGLTLALFSALICAVYFLPSARNDLVQRQDGSFTWRYMDTQHFHSIAASIKDDSPPKTPGTATAELLYHFGPFAPAAAISRLDGLNLGDAVARVTRGASLWALVLSCFGLGTLLSVRATGREFGGIISVAGLFFYGSLLSLFTDEVNRLGHVMRAVLFTIPEARVPAAAGGPFDHFLGGHSLLHGLGAITAIMGLCLVGGERKSALGWRGIILLALPALAVPVNSVAASYCVGMAGILLFWSRLGTIRSWLSILLMMALFFGAWKIMGYSHAPDAAQLMIKEHVSWQWWTLAVWFIVGLGFRIVGFRWISRSLKDPVSAVVLASVLGLLAFSLLLQLRDANERYGIYFLQSLFSIFAFSRVTSGCWQDLKRSQMIAEWLSLAKTGMIFVSGIGALIACVALVTHHHTGTTYFGRKLVLSCLLLALLAGTSALMKRSFQFSIVISAVLMGVLMVGFLAWTPDWLRYGMGRVETDITYAPGEVRGLRRLGQIMQPSERFATNKHSLDRDGILPDIKRSYGYSALSERPVLLEGYLARGEIALPWFETLLHDNDLLFSTTDPEMLRNIARTWNVRWLVARPGTDISLSKPLPAWLVQQQDGGDLRIYRID